LDVWAYLDSHTSGTSFETILAAKPSIIAVLPTPGGPMSWMSLQYDTYLEGYEMDLPQGWTSFFEIKLMEV
jgi:hypothetical protein